MDRRRFLQSTAAATFASSSPLMAAGDEAADAGELIDIHQHINYSGRLNDALVAHQKTMGVTKTVLLPAGTATERPSTHEGRSNGLAAKIFGTEAAARLAAQHPGSFVYFANEVPDLPGTKAALEKWLKNGAVGIGEQKFALGCASKEMQLVYEIAREYDVPVLIHFQNGMYNIGFEQFYKMLEKFPTVNFIGHAQTWWGNIDKDHDPLVMYPKTEVTPGGLTDKYLSDYPNIFGDMSAGSGQNALTRDPEHAAGFLERHQDKLCFASDCSDSIGNGDGCIGSKTEDVVRGLVSEPTVLRKIFSSNARKLIRFG